MVMLFVFLSIEDDVITYLNILISIAAILKFSSCSSSSSLFPLQFFNFFFEPSLKVLHLL